MLALLVCLVTIAGIAVGILRQRDHTNSSRTSSPRSGSGPGATLPRHCAAGAPAPRAEHAASELNAVGGRVGAQALGTTAYAVPAGAIFVSPTGADGAPGSVTAPVRTVQHAVDIAQSGSTIVLRAGIYREMVDIPASKPLTLQPYPHEVVWFSGSRAVGGWAVDGSAWRLDGWTVRLNHDDLDPPLLIGADPRAGYPDMVFLDGRPLHQVATRADVVRGSFFVDEAASQLFIGSSPQGHAVEASVLPEALNVQSASSLVRGLGFMHYATSISNGGAVRGWQGVTFENDVFTDNAAAGLTLRGNDVVRNVTSTGNGQLGIHGYMASGSLIENSVVSSNNTDRFNPEAAAGGIKLTVSANVTMRGDVAEDNYGHGLWFDQQSDHATAVHNITRRNNRGAGIMFEWSDFAIIAGNISTDNEVGIQAGEASHVQVWNNTMVNNRSAFSAYQGTRAQPVEITVRNNILAAGPDSRLLLDNADFTHSRTWRDMAWTSDYNAFYRRCTSVTSDVTSLANGAAAPLTYRSLHEQTAANAQDRHSLVSDDVPTDPFTSVAAHGIQRPAPAGRALGAGAPWPPDVAAALGEPAPGPVDIGAPVS